MVPRALPHAVPQSPLPCVARRTSRRRCGAPARAGPTPPQVSRRVVDSAGAWLVSHPAPLWLVNNPIKRWFTTATAGNYDREAAAAELEEKISSDGVVLFSATYCPFSGRVKQELNERCIPYTVYETNVMPSGPALVAEMGRKTGRTSIPSLFIAGVSIGGCYDGTPGLRPLISSGGLPAALAKCSPEFTEKHKRLQAERKCTALDTA